LPLTIIQNKAKDLCMWLVAAPVPKSASSVKITHQVFLSLHSSVLVK
jgi:hypothetical protein